MHEGKFQIENKARFIFSNIYIKILIHSDEHVQNQAGSILLNT